MQVLLSYFDAFKFPSSEVVQFRALVTPCLPACEPVQCDTEDSSGELRSVQSFGRRRRRRSTSSTAVSSPSAREDLLLVQSIRIMDKFGFDPSKLAGNASDSSTVFVSEDAAVCVNLAGVVVAGIVFLAAQLAVIAVWTCVWQRRRGSKQRHLDGLDGMSVSVSVPSMHSGHAGSHGSHGSHSSHAGSHVSRTDSLCKLYDTGYARRF